MRDVDALNAGYAGQLLEQYLENPSSVPPEWRALFERGERRPRHGPSGARQAARGLGRRQRPDRGTGARAPAETDEVLLNAVAAAASLVRATRTHGHRAARLDPLGTEPSGDPSLEPERLGPHARAPATRSRLDPAHVRRGRHARGRARAAARDLQRHDRLRDRAHRRPRGAHVAARGDRDRAATGSPCPTTSSGAARAPRRGRGLRGVPAAHVPRPEAVLARGPRPARAHARRVDRPRRRRRRRPDRDRHGAPRPPQRADPRRRAPVRRRSCASSRASGRSMPSPRTRRAARATSSTTSARARPAPRRAARSASR